jgi:hypothetical protein
MPAIQGRGEGYDVFVVADASDGVSIEAHDMTVRRMVQADIAPISWMAVFSEWQRDWARTERLRVLAQVLVHPDSAAMKGGITSSIGATLTFNSAGGAPLTTPPQRTRVSQHRFGTRATASVRLGSAADAKLSARGRPLVGAIL